MDLSILPKDILNIIFRYLQNPEAKLIMNEIKNYDREHNWVLTKMYKKYYVKNIMSFSCYYFDKLVEPFDYETYQESLSYEDYINS